MVKFVNTEGNQVLVDKAAVTALEKARNPGTLIHLAGGTTIQVYENFDQVAADLGIEES